MIRVVTIDDETGERVELDGSAVVVLVSDGDSMQMMQAGEAQDSEVACEVVEEARRKLHETDDRIDALRRYAVRSISIH